MLRHLAMRFVFDPGDLLAVFGARTTPQKSTIAPASESTSRAGNSSGDSVSKTSQTEFAMRVRNRIESVIADSGVNQEIRKMSAKQCDIGLIGLAVMGENLVLNMESKGFSVAVFNRTDDVTEKFAAGKANGKNIAPTRTIEEFVGALQATAQSDDHGQGRRAGRRRHRATHSAARAGRRHHRRRQFALHRHAAPLQGTGSARPSLRRLRRLGRRRRRAERALAHARRLARILGNHRADLPQDRRQVDGEPCCRYMGPDGAGHYVKMVHNGIEYGDMQLICEAYAILKDVARTSRPAELAEIFAEWNKGELDSYLIEITAQIFRKIDPETGKPLVDVILDKAGQKGTGIWTLQSAISQSVVISTINAAVEARVISSRKEERVAASKILPQPKVPKFTAIAHELIDAVRDALYASKIVSYAQGMELLGAASVESKWNLNFGDIATIWRGGCIIRAEFLNRINEAYERDPALHNLLLDPYFTDIIAKTQQNWRVAVADRGRRTASPCPAFSASLAYFDSYRQARLPSNLLQAQRDFFGAHTYERVDKPGVFHTEWLESETTPTEKPAATKEQQRAAE